MTNKKIRVYPSWVIFSLIFLIFALLSFNSISQIINILGKELQDVDMNFLTKYTVPIWLLGVFFFFFFKIFFSSKLSPDVYTIHKKTLTIIPKEHGFVFGSVCQIHKQFRIGTELHKLNLPDLGTELQITIGYVLCSPTTFFLHLEDVQKMVGTGKFSEKVLFGHIFDIINKEILLGFKATVLKNDSAPQKVFSIEEKKEISLKEFMMPLTIIDEGDMSRNGNVHIRIVSIETK